MEITKQHILSGDIQAFQRLLLVNYCNPSKANKQVISFANCQKIAAEFSRRYTFSWQEEDLKLLYEVAKEAVPEASELDIAYVRFCFEVVIVFQLAARLDSALDKDIYRLQAILFQHSLKGSQFWLTEHSLKNLVDTLCLAFQGWQSNYGQHSENFSLLLQQSLAQLEQASTDDEVQNLELGLKSSLKQQQAYLQRFAERMQAAELGKIKNQAAQFQVYRFLNKALANKVLPQLVLDYISGELINYLHQLLVQKGIMAKEWEHAKTLINELFALYQPDFAINDRYKQLPAKLQYLLFGQDEPSVKAQDLLNNIAFDITQLNQGKTIADCLPAESLLMPDHIAAMEKVASQELLQQVQSCKEGQWFILHSEQGELRCQLLLKLEDYQRVLLSNFVGQRALVASYDEFAYLLSSQSLQILPSRGPLLRSFHSRLDRLLSAYKETVQHFDQMQQSLEQQQKEQAELAKRQEAAEKARQEALVIARRRAEASKKAEQEKLAAQQAELKKAQLERDEQLQADLRRHARLSLDSLTLGSWAEYQEENQASQRVKLAVKFAATGRFVFVDDDGMTILEAQRDELVEMLLSERFRLLESDKKFAERLAKIVSELRTPQ